MQAEAGHVRANWQRRVADSRVWGRGAQPWRPAIGHHQSSPLVAGDPLLYSSRRSPASRRQVTLGPPRGTGPTATRQAAELAFTTYLAGGKTARPPDRERESALRYFSPLPRCRPATRRQGLPLVYIESTSSVRLRSENSVRCRWYPPEPLAIGTTPRTCSLNRNGSSLLLPINRQRPFE